MILVEPICLMVKYKQKIILWVMIPTEDTLVLRHIIHSISILIMSIHITDMKKILKQVRPMLRLLMNLDTQDLPQENLGLQKAHQDP